jgi:hypothetical protein
LCLTSPRYYGTIKTYNNDNTNERRNMKTPNEVIAKLNDAKNGIYSAAELESIWVPNEMLPERYHDNREGGSNLKRAGEIYDKEIVPKVKNMRGESVVIQDGKVMSDNTERLAVLNRYRDAVEADYANFPDSVGEEDFYVENEDRLYRNQQAFASAIGLDLEEEE